MSTNPNLLTWEDAVVWLRKQPDQQQLVRDAFYDDPLVEAAERYFRSSEWHDVAKLISGRGGKALDVGAGRGIASFALARQGFDVSALEPDPSAIVGAEAIRQLSRDSGLAIQVVEEFSEGLPFPDHTFDVVFARAVLHHTRDLDGACREMYRVLRPGGLFLGVREHVISRESDLDQFLASHPLHRLYGGEHAFLLSRYVEALEKAKFSHIVALPPLSSAINLFPHTRATLRDAVVEKLSRVLPLRPLWKAILGSEWALSLLLSIAERFDNRPGRLYSFVCQKASA
ncbi:class I SAM-dependent methyltransferase [Tardiphaga sp.]|jgi:SAM-dependent methyltransferase|uniref:class I SAM-dependent methyltransferase n=1 Tax=Tardiphaga sp. TaxID=1926292 RepID=UPI0037DA6488